MAESLEDNIPQELAGRWHPDVVLKRDVFSTVERGKFLTPDGEADAVLRRLDQVPWGTWLLARHLFAREKRALAVVGSFGIAPRLFHAGSNLLVRGWIDGVPLHIAKPVGDAGYFRSAKAALRKLHRAGVCHNDLAKEQNWLRGADGRAYLTDFQLAAYFRRRHWLFRLAAYEDLRHMLKHKRRYAPDALTATERRVLARKSLPTRIWMASGKRIYYAVTRGMLNYTDREGAGPRLVNDAPKIVERLKSHPRVRDAAIAAFPDRRAGTGLYAFVEADGATEAALIDFVGEELGRDKAPERLQIVEAMPRDMEGRIRGEVLQLVAMNQIDQIDQLLQNDAERSLMARIVAGRRNLRDRFAF